MKFFLDYKKFVQGTYIFLFFYDKILGGGCMRRLCNGTDTFISNRCFYFTLIRMRWGLDFERNTQKKSCPLARILRVWRDEKTMIYYKLLQHNENTCIEDYEHHLAILCQTCTCLVKYIHKTFAILDLNLILLIYSVCRLIIQARRKKKKKCPWDKKPLRESRKPIGSIILRKGISSAHINTNLNTL